LEVHHRTYERLGREMDKDLMVVCEFCHPGQDVKRAQEAQVRAANSLYAARLEGWARKVYGDYWYLGDKYEIEREFNDWVEHRWSLPR
jgi:hypothetical protein